MTKIAEKHKIKRGVISRRVLPLPQTLLKKKVHRQALLSKAVNGNSPVPEEVSQFNVVSLSMAMFQDTKPMEGVELEALINTIKKQKSKNPTSLF
jgi:hypothetical protein